MANKANIQIHSGDLTIIAAWIAVAIMISTVATCSHISDVEREKTKQLELQLELSKAQTSTAETKEAE